MVNGLSSLLFSYMTHHEHILPYQLLGGGARANQKEKEKKKERCDIYNYMLLTKIHSEILRVIVDFWFGSGSGCGHTRSTQHGSSSPNWLLASTRSSYRYKCNPTIGYQSYYYKLVLGLFTVEFLKLQSTVPWLTSPNNRGGNK